MKLVDAKNVRCPMPIVKVVRAIQEEDVGNIIEVHATDRSFEADIRAWCNQTGHKIVSFEEENGVFKAQIQKLG